MEVGLVNLGWNAVIYYLNKRMHACFSKFMSNEHYLRSGFITGGWEVVHLLMLVLCRTSQVNAHPLVI